jgi:Tol biopolymer transport system component
MRRANLSLCVAVVTGLGWAMGATAEPSTPCARPYSCWGGLVPDDPGALRFGLTASPDGSRLAFVSGRSGNFEIYLMRPDGTGLRNLTNHPAGDYGPAFSPDGSRLAFISGRDGGAAVYVVKLGNPRQVVRVSAAGQPDVQVFDPVFSPDAATIAFTVSRAGETEVILVSADGSSQPRPVSRPVPDAFGPAFSADGRLIQFQAVRDGETLVYAVAAEGPGEPIAVTAPLTRGTQASAR